MHRPTGIAGGLAVLGLLAGGVLLPAAAAATQQPVNGVIAFVSVRDASDATVGVDDIYLTPDSGGPVARVVADPGDDEFPAISPDGKWLAYTSDVAAPGHQQVYVCRLHPSVPRPFCDETHQVTVVTGSASNPHWSPDGLSIVFAASVAGSSSFHVFAVPADGTGMPVQLTFGVNDTQPSYSPDGAHIVYTRGGGGTSDVWRIDADGTDAQAWVAGPGIDSGAVYSPDGSALAFASARDGDLDLYRIAADAPQGAANPAVRITDTTTGERLPSWSPDGTRLAFWSFPSGAGLVDGDISTIAVDGTDRRDLTADHAGGDIAPSWGRSFNGRPVG